MSTTDANKQLARRVYEEGLNQGRFDVLDEIVDPGFVNHAAPADAPRGSEGVKAVFAMIRSTAPDYHLEVEHVIGEGDLVALHGIGVTGPMQGVDVTGRSARIPQVHIFRFDGGRIVEHWGIRHDLPAMQELGVIDGPATH